MHDQVSVQNPAGDAPVPAIDRLGPSSRWGLRDRDDSLDVLKVTWVPERLRCNFRSSPRTGPHYVIDEKKGARRRRNTVAHIRD